MHKTAWLYVVNKLKCKKVLIMSNKTIMNDKKKNDVIGIKKRNR